MTLLILTLIMLVASLQIGGLFWINRRHSMASSHPLSGIADVSDMANMTDIVMQQLPQTQCGRCGYPGCRAYAEAVTAGAAPNLCAPGGDKTATALAQLTDRPIMTTHPSVVQDYELGVAEIDSNDCIGCTRCIQVCPTDAIIGGARMQHWILEADCSGCDLCLSACPVDCIALAPREQTDSAIHWEALFVAREERRHQYEADLLEECAKDTDELTTPFATERAVSRRNDIRRKVLLKELAKAKLSGAPDSVIEQLQTSLPPESGA